MMMMGGGLEVTGLTAAASPLTEEGGNKMNEKER